VTDPGQPHARQHIGRQRRTPAAAAKEDEAFAGSEQRLVVRAIGVDPELQHAAWRMKRPGKRSLALQLANIADVHELHIRIVLQTGDRFDIDGLDACRGVGQQVPESHFKLHVHSRA
jgi:hypothetical protein